jgi:hypothetical protein
LHLETSSEVFEDEVFENENDGCIAKATAAGDK